MKRKSQHETTFFRKENWERNKKAQHEILGFILIVVIVVIIGLFLLVFYLRQDSARYESLNVQNFLRTSMQVTSPCIVSIEPLQIQDLTKRCRQGSICKNGLSACQVLREEFRKIIEESWLIDPERPENAYFLNIFYMEEEDEEPYMEEILTLQDGNCSGTRIGSEYFLHESPGKIIVTMEICYI